MMEAVEIKHSIGEAVREGQALAAADLETGVLRGLGAGAFELPVAHLDSDGARAAASEMAGDGAVAAPNLDDGLACRVEDLGKRLLDGQARRRHEVFKSALIAMFPS